VGFFSSKGRGDNGSSESARENAATTPGSNSSGQSSGQTGDKRAQSWQSIPGAQAAPDSRSRENESTSGRSAGLQGGKKNMATIGQSIVFKGELTGDEDLEIDGQVEGNVRLANNTLTIGSSGRVTAQVVAKSIIVIGRVKGNLTATERIEIQATGIVEGDVKAPRLNVQEGAVVNGGIDMTASSSAAEKTTASPSQPAREEARKPAASLAASPAAPTARP
jgi:cytoskeletal protein CcmA (bactofilin family)